MTNRINEVNSTSTGIYNYVTGEITNRLGVVNSTSNYIWNYLTLNISNSLSGLNTTVSNTYSYVLANSSGPTDLTGVMSALDSIYSDLTTVKNNMFTQGNATGSFLINYLSTVYVEPGTRESLWILTTDLLGNSKTAGSATCNIVQNGVPIASGTTEISSGGVYSYWDVPVAQTVGSYNWNCSIENTKINVPFYVGVSSQASLFRISGLTAGSPIYPNENVLIESSFTGQNGSSVDPDSINITIYDHNNNVWASTTLVGMTKGADNIWRYTKSVEASPTTGMYTAHLQATYLGISDSKTVQFRIATGGPYKVYLDCPISSVIGSNLVCTVIINDEGEAPTESTSTIWVDTNGNSALDTGEPQTSFSKETQPLQNISEVATINVPLTYATGNFVVRVDTEYLNSGQPHSTASDSVTLTEVTITPAAPLAGGGGGGGGSSTPSNLGNAMTIIDVQGSATITEQQFIKGVVAEFEKDEVLTINLQPSNANSVESHTINMASVGTDSVTLLISSNPLITLKLKVGEERQVDIDKDGRNDIYLKLNKIVNGKADMVIKSMVSKSFSITGEVINLPSNLMDVLTSMAPEYKIVTPGSNIIMEVTLYNLGTEEIKDAKIKYTITNSSGYIIKTSEETLAIYTRLQTLKEFVLPVLAEGRYYINTEVDYNVETASSQTSFEVKGRGINAVQVATINKWLLIIVLFILTIAIIIPSIVARRLAKHLKKDDMIKEFRKKEFKVISSEVRSTSLEVKLKQLEELKNRGVLSKKSYAEERKSLLAKFGEAVMNHKNVFAYLMVGMLIFMASTVTYETGMTGFAVNNALSSANGSLWILLVVLFVLALLIIFRKKVVLIFKKMIEFVSKISDSFKKHSKNSIRGLINKEVYSENGNYIGRVKDVVIEGYKISHFKITLDKKYQTKERKGIVIKYKQVIATGKVVIIDEEVAKFLEGNSEKEAELDVIKE